MKNLKILWIMIIFILSFEFFLPKKNIYYALEHIAKTNHINVNENNLKDNPLSLDIENANIFYRDILLGHFKNANFKLFGFYNELLITNISFENSFAKFIPKNIKYSKISYSIINPKLIKIYSTGNFGELNASLNIFTKKINIKLKLAKNYNKTYSFLKYMKYKKGDYFYEYKL